MDEHIETPENDDVEGHFQSLDDEGRASLPPTRAIAVTEEDVEGREVDHDLDLDVERER